MTPSCFACFLWEVFNRPTYGLLRHTKVSLRYILESYSFFAIGFTFGLLKKLICLGQEIILFGHCNSRP
jgi:hypothetical protein